MGKASLGATILWYRRHFSYLSQLVLFLLLIVLASCGGDLVPLPRLLLPPRGIPALPEDHVTGVVDVQYPLNGDCKKYMP